MSKWAAYTVALLAASLVGTAQAKDGTAAVRAVRGTADFSTGGGTWEKLSVGKVLSSGAIIRTGADSEVDLFLRQNGPVVRVTPDSTLGLDTLLYEDTGEETVIQTKLDLKNGRILGNVKKLAAASKYEVQIPTGVVGIRGTDYDISANGIVRVVTGTVQIILVEGGVTTTATVNAGQSFNPQTKVVAEMTVQEKTTIAATIRNAVTVVVTGTGVEVIVPVKTEPPPPSSILGEKTGGTSGHG